MKVAMIQSAVTADKQDNLHRAADAIRSAAQNGADMAVLPEMFCCPYENSCFRPYGEEVGGPAWQMLSAAARENNVYVVGGSIPELEDDRVYNTSFVFAPTGAQIARHRKAHLFDIDVPGGQRFKESDTLSPGNAITTFETKFGIFGLCICFDLRFEELARCMTLRGAKAIVVPAAFNMTTGPAHWELLFRQRAVDNQCYTVGTSPARDNVASYTAWGHSIVCDPWGTVVKQINEQPQISVTELDMDKVDEIRRQLPILSARRADLYEVKELS